MWMFSFSSRLPSASSTRWLLRLVGRSRLTEPAPPENDSTAEKPGESTKPSTRSSNDSRETILSECLEPNCEAPARPVDICYGAGVDFDGADAVFVMDKYECQAGHHYHVVNEDQSVRLVT